MLLPLLSDRMFDDVLTAAQLDAGITSEHWRPSVEPVEASAFLKRNGKFRQLGSAVIIVERIEMRRANAADFRRPTDAKCDRCLTVCEPIRWSRRCFRKKKSTPWKSRRWDSIRATWTHVQPRGRRDGCDWCFRHDNSLHVTSSLFQTLAADLFEAKLAVADYNLVQIAHQLDFGVLPLEQRLWIQFRCHSRFVLQSSTETVGHFAGTGRQGNIIYMHLLL